MPNGRVTASLAEFARLVREKPVNPFSGPLKVGVDLGTTDIVLAVLDANNKAVAGAIHPSSAVRDGIVVDYVDAVRTVRKETDKKVVKAPEPLLVTPLGIATDCKVEK